MAKDLTQVLESPNQDHVSQVLPPYASSTQSGSPFTDDCRSIHSTDNEILSGSFRIPKCVKENIQFVYTVAFIVKTIVLSWSRTVFLSRVVEDKCLSSAAFPSRGFLDITLLV